MELIKAIAFYVEVGDRVGFQKPGFCSQISVLLQKLSQKPGFLCWGAYRAYAVRLIALNVVATV